MTTNLLDYNTPLPVGNGVLFTLMVVRKGGGYGYYLVMATNKTRKLSQKVVSLSVYQLCILLTVTYLIMYYTTH